MKRDEMKEAKKTAELGLHDGCGEKALLSPVLRYCQKHLSDAPARRERKKPPA
jgi:hypothetical protein